ncbi:MAG: 4-hydroxy-3-methylbut-2-enyl diphosphate reductase [Lentisphaeria bacterium]|nr:4-hydroxy-3-methylbut-2-enyl diphosphate reductase [Lentisphaeria bacterium]
MSSSVKKYIMSEVCGFCRGVRNAIALFDEAVKRYGKPVYILHELVHNSFVTDSMRARGAVFADKSGDIPDGAVAMIGAHGVSPEVESDLRSRCTVIDSTCPRVKALQKSARSVGIDQELILLCKKNHPEALGVLGYVKTPKVYPVHSLSDIDALPDMKSPVLLTQTTVSSELSAAVNEAVSKRFANIKISSGICNSSIARQEAVKRLASVCDRVLVIGSQHSSNAVELKNIVQSHGVSAYLIDSSKSICDDMLEGASCVGVTAGASTPDELIDDVRTFLEEYGYCGD